MKWSIYVSTCSFLTANGGRVKSPFKTFTRSLFISPPSWPFAIHLGIFLQIWSNQGRYPAYDADNSGQKGQWEHLQSSWSGFSIVFVCWKTWQAGQSPSWPCPVRDDENAGTACWTLPVRRTPPALSDVCWCAFWSCFTAFFCSFSHFIPAPLPFLDIVSFISSMILWSVDFTIKSTSKTLQKSCCWCHHRVISVLISPITGNLKLQISSIYFQKSANIGKNTSMFSANWASILSPVRVLYSTRASILSPVRVLYSAGESILSPVRVLYSARASILSPVRVLHPLYIHFWHCFARLIRVTRIRRMMMRAYQARNEARKPPPVPLFKEIKIIISYYKKKKWEKITYTTLFSDKGETLFFHSFDQRNSLTSLRHLRPQASHFVQQMVRLRPQARHIRLL